MISLLLILCALPGLSAQEAGSLEKDSTFKKKQEKWAFVASVGTSLASTRMPEMRRLFRDNDVAPDYHIDPSIDLTAGIIKSRLKAGFALCYGININNRFYDLGRVAHQKTGISGGFAAGYDVLQNSKWRLYVNGGVGSIHYEYSVYTKTDKTVPYSDLFSGSTGVSVPSLMTTNKYWELSLELAKRPKENSNTQPSIRLGFRSGMKPQAISSDAVKLDNAGKNRISQLFIQFLYYFSSCDKS